MIAQEGADKKVILVTGGTSGIGKETAIALAKEGTTVIFTARTDELGQSTQKDIMHESNNSAVSYLVVDLSSLTSVRHLAAEFSGQYHSLDVLINNAGVMEQERKLSADGFELDFAVNYLAPFLLTNLLLPLIKSSAPSRIVNVCSSLHKEGVINFDDLQSEKHFGRYQAYAQSKLALLLFTKKLARMLSGTGVTVNALHPGVVATNMTVSNIANMNPVLRRAYSMTLLSPERGALTSVYLATSPYVANISGQYFEKRTVARASPLADDSALSEKLWETSLSLVGL